MIFDEDALIFPGLESIGIIIEREIIVIMYP